MSDAAVLSVTSTRVRAISFASGALVVALICLALLAVSRVVTYLDPEPIVGVSVEIAPRVEPRRPAAHTAPPPSRPSVDTTAPPVATDIPVDRAMFARTLRCFTLRPGQERPAHCPPGPSPSQLEAAGGDFRGAPGVIMAPPPQNTAQAFAGVPPPCIEGFGPARDMAGTQFCMRGGLVPQESARSPEAICASGGIGPCTPPAFRPDEVSRFQHTQ